MPKNTALEPIFTQTGGAQNIPLPQARVTHQALDPLMRQFSGTQTINLELAR